MIRSQKINRTEQNLLLISSHSSSSSLQPRAMHFLHDLGRMRVSSSSSSQFSPQGLVILSFQQFFLLLLPFCVHNLMDFARREESSRICTCASFGSERRCLSQTKLHYGNGIHNSFLCCAVVCVSCCTNNSTALYYFPLPLASSRIFRLPPSLLNVHCDRHDQHIMQYNFFK